MKEIVVAEGPGSGDTAENPDKPGYAGSGIKLLGQCATCG